MTVTPSSNTSATVAAGGTLHLRRRFHIPHLPASIPSITLTRCSGIHQDHRISQVVPAPVPVLTVPRPSGGGGRVDRFVTQLLMRTTGAYKRSRQVWPVTTIQCHNIVRIVQHNCHTQRGGRGGPHLDLLSRCVWYRYPVRPVTRQTRMLTWLVNDSTVPAMGARTPTRRPLHAHTCNGGGGCGGGCAAAAHHNNAARLHGAHPNPNPANLNPPTNPHPQSMCTSRPAAPMSFRNLKCARRARKKLGSYRNGSLYSAQVAFTMGEISGRRYCEKPGKRWCSTW